jgi:hypothetical protein
MSGTGAVDRAKWLESGEADLIGRFGINPSIPVYGHSEINYTIFQKFSFFWPLIPTGF